METTEAPQYYYDSSAQQWWVFDTAKGEWELCPETEQAEQAAPDAACGEDDAAAAAADAAAAAAAEGSGEKEASAEASAAEPAAETDSAAAAASRGDRALSEGPSGESSAQDPTNSNKSVSPSSGGSSVSGGVTFRLDSAASRGSRSSPSGCSKRQPQGDSGDSSSEEEGGDELGSALDRLMTTNFSRAATMRGGDSTSSSFPWPMGDDGSDDEHGDTSDGDNEPESPLPEPIVRRVTRRMTFRDQGGLAGCLQKAVAMRQQIIDTEKGGQVPGAEDAGTKEEAWKIQARNRAHTAGTAARERAKSRWRSAALELAGHPRDAQGATPHAGAQRFADLVGLVAASRKKEIMGLRVSPADDDGTDRPRRTSDLGQSAAAGAASAELPGLWKARRSSDMQGRIRFADTTLKDPTNQHQVSGLLGTSSRRSSAAAPADTAVPQQ